MPELLLHVDEGRPHREEEARVAVAQAVGGEVREVRLPADPREGAPRRLVIERSPAGPREDPTRSSLGTIGRRAAEAFLDLGAAVAPEALDRGHGEVDGAAPALRALDRPVDRPLPGDPSRPGLEVEISPLETGGLAQAEPVRDMTKNTA